MASGVVEPAPLEQALGDYAATVAETSPRLAALQAWQSERLLARYGEHPLLRFFADEVMQGVDTGGLADRPQASAKRLNRLLGGSTASAAAAVEYAALSHALDRAMVDALGNRPLTTTAYVRAYRRVGEAERRCRQLDLVAFVADDLAGVVHRRLSYMAFRMARHPAHAAGFGAFYDWLAGGFEAVRSDRNAERRIDEWLAAERALVSRLLG